MSELARSDERARAAIDDAHRQAVLPLLPDGARLWDVHAHLGVDADGSAQSPEALLGGMARFGVERTNVFSFANDDLAGYEAANRWLVDVSEAASGALVPFCRVEPGPAATGEVARSLAGGARGVKLHPLRGRFGFDAPDIDRIVAIASEHCVPVLFHTGRGVDPFAADVARLARRHPNAPLILAHCAIGDLHATAEAIRDLPNVVVDTSLWNPIDAQVLVASVAPERLVLGTDAPYYTPDATIARMVLPMRRGGASDDQVRAALWNTADGISAGRSPASLSAPLDPRVGAMPHGCLRAHEYLLQATAFVWTRQADAIGVLPLARRALAAVDHPLADLAAGLVGLAAETWPVDLAHASRAERLALSWSTFRLIDYADILAVSTPLP